MVYNEVVIFKNMVQVFPLRQKVYPSYSQLFPINNPDNDEQDYAQPSARCIDLMKSLINLELYSLSMAFLTVYSIFAIDIEKSFVGQQAAYVFGYIHILCIAIFLADMVLSWICKEEYKFSFYFWIDVISTLSMVMEITWVDNFLTDNSNLPAILTIAKVVKASRLSRIGGRAAKIILMFLAYLKNKREDEERMKNDVKATESVAADSGAKTATVIDTKNKEQNITVAQDQDESNNEVVNELPLKAEFIKKELAPIAEQKITQRSQISEVEVVHQKASSLGLSKDSLVVPVFAKKRSREVRNSSKIMLKKKNQRGKCFDTTNLIERMQHTFRLEPLVRPNVDSVLAADLERRWSQLCERDEQALKQQRQKIHSNKENFKLGEILKQRIQKNIIIMIMSLIIILPLISADTWFNKDPSVDQFASAYFQMVDGSIDAAVAREILADMINSAQQGTYPVLDLKYQYHGQGNDTYPGSLMEALDDSPPVSDFMRVELIEAVGSNYAITFNGRGISRITAMINIARSCFITILLIFSTIIFMYSIETNALTPLEKMSIAINKISINPFDALKQAEDQNKEPGNSKEDKDGKSDLETNVLEEVVKKMTKILALGAGETGSSLISNTAESVQSESGCNQLPCTRIHGIFLCIKLSHFQDLCLDPDVLPILNKISTYFHDIVMQNGGTIVETNPPYFLFFWHTPDDFIGQPEQTKYFVAGNPFNKLGKMVETQKNIHVVLRSYLQMNLALSEINQKWIEEHRTEEQVQCFYVRAGVHIGDAFQGSIGDTLKIQVKCIGRDVDLSRSLCQLAEKYKLSNIVSEELAEVFELEDLPEAHMRRIDYVRENSDQDYCFWLYTYDFTLSKMAEQSAVTGKVLNKRRKKIKKQRTFRQQKERSIVYKNRADTLSKLRVAAPIDVVLPFTLIEKRCLKPFNDKFYHSWNLAIDNYYSGEWDDAAPLFESINERFDLDYKEPVSLMMLQRIAKMGHEPTNEWDKAVEVIFE